MQHFLVIAMAVQPLKNKEFFKYRILQNILLSEKINGTEQCIMTNYVKIKIIKMYRVSKGIN